MKKNSNWKAVVHGHTDQEGSNSYNLDLSKKRALTAAKYLNNLGIPKNRILPIGHGYNQPISAKNENNRRVEITFKQIKN